jgi:hypothetical protein
MIVIECEYGLVKEIRGYHKFSPTLMDKEAFLALNIPLRDAGLLIISVHKSDLGNKTERAGL